MVKLVRLEQLRGIWTHVVKNSKTGDKAEKVGANHTKKYSRKNKMAVDAADEDNENTSTQKEAKGPVVWSTTPEVCTSYPIDWHGQ
jgi:two-component response regulator (ARR-B family)